MFPPESLKAGYRRSTSRSKARRPSRPPKDAAKEARREARPASTSLLARSARLRALSLGVPPFSSRSAFSLKRSARSKSVEWASAYSRMTEAALERSAGFSGAEPPFRRRRRPKSRPSPRPAVRGRYLNARLEKDGKLPSFMAHMINRWALFVVVSLSALLLGGCVGFLQNPHERANKAITEANESIAEHNKLFDKARTTYADAKKKIESGEDPSKLRDSITEAKKTLEKARAHLDDARDSLATVQGLDVDHTVKEYASLLTQAMDAQLAAEAKEVEFYDLLEEDPALKNNREKALGLLSKVGAGYKKAEKAYAKAQDFADAHPKVIQASKGS